MFFFYIIIIFIFLDLFTTKKSTKDKLAKLLMLILLIFAMLRSVFVGSDMPMFSIDFSVIAKMPFLECLNTRYELLNILFFKLIGLISTNYQTLTVLSSLVINFGVYKLVVKNQKNPLSTAIFYFTLNYYFIFFCLLRQTLALLVIVIGLKFLANNQTKKFVLSVILASMFHKSAIIFLILLLFKNIKFKKESNIIIIVVLLSIFGFIFGKNIMLISMKLISTYEKYLSTSYINSSYITAGLYTLTSFCFLLFGIIVPSKKCIAEEQQKDRKYDLLKYILAIGTVISAISMKIAVFSRIYLYFGFFAIIWLSDNLELLQNKNNKFLWKSILYLSTLTYVIVISKFDWFGVFPYEFFWENGL